MNLFQYEIVWIIPILIVVSIIWSVIKGRKRAKEMRDAGASLNLREATKSDKKVLKDSIGQSRLFTDGSSWPKTVLVGDVNGVRFTLADYNFHRGTTKSKTKETTLLTIQSNFLRLPPFTLMPSGWLIDSLSSMVGYRDINFDSSPSFPNSICCVLSMRMTRVTSFLVTRKLVPVHSKKERMSKWFVNFLAMSCSMYWKPIRGLAWMEEKTNLFLGVSLISGYLRMS